MARKDDELQLLEQAVHAEKTKAARLETLIKKRGPNSGNLSVQGPALVQGPGAYAGGRLVSSSSTEGASPVPRCLKVKATAGVTVGVGRGKGKESK